MALSLTPEQLAALPPDGGPEFNRLVFEKSPYLLQHARNPVDWHPWSDETLRVAKEQGKPIFLSVGYSTCHWCHVMERESFEREDVAKIMNAHFIPVKVDREERPDLDDAYMLATQVLSGRGGWPNSLWLTPEGKPWAAGTYFPREDRGGHPGFKSLLLRAAEFWRTRRADAERLGEQVAQAMLQASSFGGEAGGGALSKDLCERALEEALRNFDSERGGLLGAPKFPPHGALALLARELRRERRPGPLDAFERTLDAMARGGVHDHIGGGFHRYSTDAEWLLPHFEKMLYDNAQLLAAYADAFALTGEARYRRVAEGICAWALREMAHPEGGFYSAMDADSEGEEGKFYVWTRAEVSSALGEEDAAFFCDIYGAKEGGNFRDEATGRRTGANVLHLAKPIEAVARERGMAPEALEARLRPLREKLLSARNGRVWPHIDDKVLADWNGLMVSGLVRAGRAFGEPGHVRAAERAARFVLANLMANGRLMRSWREGAASVPGCLTDYALFAAACLDLHEATGDGDWLAEARRLAEEMVGRFADEGGGFFLTEAGQEAGFLRGKPAQDQQMPSGNGAAAALLVRLARASGEPRYADLARRTLDHFEPIMRRAPLAATSLILAAADYLEGGAAHAAGGDGAPVQAELRLGEAQVAQGQSVPLELVIKVAEGYCVPALGAEPEGTRPTRVCLASPGFLALDGLAGPPGEKAEGQPGPVWRGAVRLTARLRAAADAPLGRSAVRVEVEHQACGEGACLPPGTLAAEAEVVIVEK